MLKNILTYIGTTLLFLLFTFSLVQAVPIVELNLLDSEITVGEDFDVEVWLTDTLTGVDTDWSSPEELLAFGFDVDTTGFVTVLSTFEITLPFIDLSYGPGNVTGVTFPGIDVSLNQDVLLAVLTFSATGVGDGTINVLGTNNDLFYGLFYEVYSYDIDASLDFTVNANPVPEPGLGLFSRNRKKI